MGLDISFYIVPTKLNQEELNKIVNATGIGEDYKVQTFSGRGYVYILDTLRDDLKTRYKSFEDYVVLEREDVEKLIVKNVEGIINDIHRYYINPLSLFTWMLEEIDFDKETIIRHVNS